MRRYFFFFSETRSNKQAGGIPNRQQQVRELARAHACACLRALTDTSTAGNPRAADAPACQINSHRSPRAATNVNLRKGESVQSLSAAIFTHMAHAAHARPQIGKVRRKKKKFAGQFETYGGYQEASSMFIFSLFTRLTRSDCPGVVFPINVKLGAKCRPSNTLL